MFLVLMENSCDKKKGTGQQCWGVDLIQFKQPGKNGAASQVIAINESGSSKYFQVHVITLRVSKASKFITSKYIYGPQDHF